MSFQEAIAQFITLLVVLDPAATVPKIKRQNGRRRRTRCVAIAENSGI